MHGLYLVTPDWRDSKKLLAVSEMGLQGGARVLQYRNKTASPKLRQQQAQLLQELCHNYRVPFIINDDIELCLTLNACGLHLGATDLDFSRARKILGPDKIIGASCYSSLEFVQTATRASASYLALGGFYPSRIKKYPVTTPTQLIATVKANFDLPLVVIGGITLENAPSLLIQKPDMLAVISAVYFAKDPKVAAASLAALINEKFPHENKISLPPMLI